MIQGISNPAGSKLVNRGDPQVYDKGIAVNFTADAWTDWDISGIVPVNAKAVILQIRFQSAAVGDYLKLRNKDSQDDCNAFHIIPGTNTEAHYRQHILQFGSTPQILQYYMHGAPTLINLVVVGWLL